MPRARRSSSSLTLLAAGLVVSGCTIGALNNKEGLSRATATFAQKFGLRTEPLPPTRTKVKRRRMSDEPRSGPQRGRVWRGRAPGRVEARDHIARLIDAPYERDKDAIYKPRKKALRGTLPGITPLDRPMTDRQFVSSTCRRLHAVAGAQTTILRSPTIGATLDTEKKASVTISYDMLDLRRARLTEEEADARCRRLLASAKLSSFVLATNESLRHASARAQSLSFQGSRRKLMLVAGQIDSYLDEGLVTMPQASVLRRYVARARAMAAAAAAEAGRREGVSDRRNANLQRAKDELLAADHDLAEIERQRRTADAFELSVSGGYNTETDSIGARYGHDGESYGKVKFSMRTGALFPRRHAFEDEATASRIESFNDPGSGTLWRLRELREASRRALKDLRKQRATLRKGVRETLRVINAPGHRFGDGLEAARLRSRLDAIVFRAELAGVEATIDEMEGTVRRLR